MTFAQTRPASRFHISGQHPARPRPNEWISRAANFVVAYAEPGAGEVLERADGDEHLVYLPDGGAEVEGGGRCAACPSPSLVVVPPGISRVTVAAPARVLRVFAAAAAPDLAALACNAQVYADGAPEVAKPEPGVLAAAGLRVHRLADYADRPMRLFRSASLMLNVFDHDRPRNTETLTPHAHADFEQASFAMEGAWVHSLRYPWSPRLSQWRDDEHLEIGSPSVVVIPATVIHTSRPVSQGHSQLVDVFSPPRRDFLARGLVCNAGDYPTDPG